MWACCALPVLCLLQYMVRLEMNKNKTKNSLDKWVNNLLINDEQITNRRRCRKIFNDPSPPPLVWEGQFDYHDEKLQQIAVKEWWEILEEDLWYYLLDLAYVELQPDLFRYLFPICLAFWHDTLMRHEAAVLGDSEFHYAIHHGKILSRMTTLEETQQIIDFFHDALIERIKMERAVTGKRLELKISAFSWIRRFNSLGQVVPLIERIWTNWWTFDHPGKAISAIVYASGLVYLKGENPFFQEDESNRCGGGSFLTENDSHIFDGPWQDENVHFLRKYLSAAYILEKLAEAVDVLRQEPESQLAERILIDAKIREDIITICIEDLLESLSHPGADWRVWK